MLIVDDSILKAYDKCPMNGYWLHERGIAHSAEAIALTFGGGIHVGVGTLYKTKDVSQACDAFKLAYSTNDPKGVRTVTKGLEIIEAWDCQLMGVPKECLGGEIMVKYPLTSGIMYVGNIDQLIEMDDEIMVEEWKTSEYPSMFISKPNQQITGYAFLASLHFNTRVDSVLITIAGLWKTSRGGWRTLKNGNTQSIFRQDPPIKIEDWEFETWQKDVRNKCMTIEAMRDGGYHTQKTEACSNFGGCQFIPLCSAGPKYREMIIESSYVPYHWNPEEKGGR